MSRLSTLSSATKAAMFGSETDKDLILLITVYDPDNTEEVVLRLADGYTKRISETADDVIYGVTSRGNDYTFLPMEITLPDEAENAAPRCSITFYDVTRYVMPVARSISGQPPIKLELVLTSAPDNVEVSFSGFKITNFTYNVDRVSADLSMISYELEPFPQYSFSPSYFPGLF